jgi:hypothetical protein
VKSSGAPSFDAANSMSKTEIRPYQGVDGKDSLVQLATQIISSSPQIHVLPLNVSFQLDRA